MAIILNSEQQDFKVSNIPLIWTVMFSFVFLNLQSMDVDSGGKNGFFKV